MEFFDGIWGVFADIAEGVRLSPLWWKLGVEQTIARYRRTVLGPFWVASTTISTGIALSVVFGAIFGGDWRGNFPFILSGVLAFQLSSGLLGDGAASTQFPCALNVRQADHKFRTPDCRILVSNGLLWIVSASPLVINVDTAYCNANRPVIGIPAGNVVGSI
jgi:hypothetical protein